MEGAVYGVYRDEDCTDLIVEMPATDKKRCFQRYHRKDTGYRLLKRNLRTTRDMCWIQNPMV